MAKVSSEKKATIEITLPEHARPLLGKLLMFLAPTFSTGLTGTERATEGGNSPLLATICFAIALLTSWMSGESYLRDVYLLFDILWICSAPTRYLDLRQAYLVNVDTARPQLAMANGPILLARHSLVLHCGLFLLSLLGWGLLNWYES